MKYILISLLMICSLARGQYDELSYFSDIMTNARMDEHRARALDSFIIYWEEYLQSGQAFEINLSDELFGTGALMSPDSTFKIYTYQYRADASTFLYGGAVVYPDGTFDQLHDRMDKSRDVSYVQANKESWYGAYYYDIIPFSIDSQRYYVLFGLDGHSRYNRRKIADVMTFTPDGPQFGHPVFGQDSIYMEREGLFRLVFEYSLDANFILDYDPKLDKIVISHLVQVPGRFEGQGPTYVPEGTFEGYRPISRGWLYVEKLFEETYMRIEDGKPEQVGKERDLFGRPKYIDRN